MAGGTFLPGVKTGDIRYERTQAKLSKNLTTLPRQILNGINLTSFKPWIISRLTELVGYDDEVLCEFVLNTLQAEESSLEAGPLQLLLAPFMGAPHAETFVQELWQWLDKAKQSGGIPVEFVADYEALLKEEAEEERSKKQEKRLGTSQPRERREGRPRNRKEESRHHLPSYSRSRSRSRSGSRERNRERGRDDPREKRYRMERRETFHRQSPQRQREYSPKPSPPRQRIPLPPLSPPHEENPPQNANESSSYSSDDEATVKLRERARRLMNKD
jgi:serine/arginine repetitive matrix protein 1